MKPRCEMDEGPKALRQFDRLVGSLLAVSRSEIQRREREYRQQVEANPNRRGPKRKAKR